MSAFRLKIVFTMVLISLMGGMGNAAKRSSGPTSAEKVLTVALFGLSLPPDTKHVGNSSDYRFLHNVLRPLISYGDHAQFVGDALVHWSFDPTFKVFYLSLRPGMAYSNGDPVTADDAVATLKRLMETGKTIHYDFSNFESVKTKGTNDFQIVLKKPDRNLLEAMTAPEFSPLHKSDYGAENPKYRVTAGAYVVGRTEANVMYLEKNTHFEGHGGPSKIILRSISKQAEIFDDANKDVDLFTSAKLDRITHEKVLNSGFSARRLNLGFSQFIGLNADRPALQDVSVRRYIQSILVVSDADLVDHRPVISKAEQLYLPDGPGRVSPESLAVLRAQFVGMPRPSAMKAGTKLRLLVGKGPLSQSLVVEKLRKGGFDPEVTIFESWPHFATLMKENTFDLIEANNDFSAIELLENLRVTFNPERPLIVLPKKSPIPKKIEVVINTEDPAARYAIFESIERELLENGLLAPLYQSNMHAYIRSTHSLEAWNKSVPEIALWKIRTL